MNDGDKPFKCSLNLLFIKGTQIQLWQIQTKEDSLELPLILMAAHPSAEGIKVDSLMVDVLGWYNLVSEIYRR